MHMNDVKIFDIVDKSLVDFWKSHNLEEKDFIELIDHLLERDVYLRSCSLKQMKKTSIAEHVES